MRKKIRFCDFCFWLRHIEIKSSSDTNLFLEGNFFLSIFNKHSHMNENYLILQKNQHACKAFF